LKYLVETAKLIKKGSVWAVCGDKTKEAWRAFLAANKHSKKQGNRIERVFFPPKPGEAAVIHEVLKAHFKSGMRVRAFASEKTARAVKLEWNLPGGFGMTLVGRGPDSKPRVTAVLVHWGGVGPERIEHHGVILKDPAWRNYFRDVFLEIREHTVPVRTLRSFLNGHKD
jgi:hypothetical protein